MNLLAYGLINTRTIKNKMFDKILSGIKSGADFKAKLSRFSAATAKEKSIRGFGLVLVLMALSLQVFAAISPNKITASASPNDLIPGGATSKNQLVRDCKANKNKIDKVFNYYSISCADLAKANVVHINSLDYGGRLYSVGHMQRGFASEVPVNIGDEFVYWRLLHAWDTHHSTTYEALKFTNANGKIFWMLFSCGNLVHFGIPAVPPPKHHNPPKKPCAKSTTQFDALACLTYHKTVKNVTRGITNANGKTAQPGDELKYELKVTNDGKLMVHGFIVRDNIADILEYAQNSTLAGFGGGSLSSEGVLSYPKVNIAPGKTITKTFSVIVTTDSKILSKEPSINDPDAYNRQLTNIYGDTINVKVPKPGVAVVASKVTELPNTGPGSTVLIYALIATVAGYLYSYRRLQLKEARIAMSIAEDQEVN